MKKDLEMANYGTLIKPYKNYLTGLLTQLHKSRLISKRIFADFLYSRGLCPLNPTPAVSFSLALSSLTDLYRNISSCDFHFIFLIQVEFVHSECRFIE